MGITSFGLMCSQAEADTVGAQARQTKVKTEENCAPFKESVLAFLNT